AQEFHRHRQSVRAARKAGDPHRHDANERRCGRRPERRPRVEARLIGTARECTTEWTVAGGPIRWCNQLRRTTVTARMKYLLIALTAILPAWGTADAQDSRDIRVRVGLGAQLQPEFVGADSMAVSPLFHVNFARGTREFNFSAPDDSPG